MDNFQIYKKTLGFSLRRVLWDILTLVLIAALAGVGYLAGGQFFRSGWIGLAIGLVIGLIAAALLARFVSYTLKAAQIAMMTRGVTEGTLPENVIEEGKKVVKERFATVAVFFAVTNVIKGIFNQLGRVITRLGENLGGEAGGAVGSTIHSAIQTMIAYLCDCCLGWVFYRKEVKAAKATCEGAVLFFRHGKTFARNMGRIFGMGLASLLVIGGVFAGVIYLILSTQAQALSGFYRSIAEAMQGAEGSLSQFLQDPAKLPIVLAIIGGLIIWGILHSTFVRPFVLTGVLRNYLESGMNDIPTEESFAFLDSKSKKFRKLHSEL